MTKKQTTPLTHEAEVVKKINSVKVIVRWNSFSPDCRPYKPSTPELVFDEPLKIVVFVPLDKELMDNFDVISMAQLSNQKEPSPIFTPLGMRYIIDQFEAVMQNGKPEETASADDDDWEDEDTSNKTTKKSSDDEWEDEEETTIKEDKDETWDENWEE